METIPVGELKSNFSAILGRVKKGERVVIGFGKKKEKVALLIPYFSSKGKRGRRLGLLKGKCGYTIKKDFQIGDEEIVSL